jgi:hypothetical protein
MPRVMQEQHVALLKQTMLPRVPECHFTKADVELLQASTGLDEAQIQQWASCFRACHAMGERENALVLLLQEEERLRFKRCGVYLFNATRAMVSPPRTTALYSAFSLNLATGFAEGIFEFKDQVWSHQLQASLAEQGAACITILPLPGGIESAGATMARVWKAARRPGFELVTHGECNLKLLAKAKEIAEQNLMRQWMQEINEKMATKEDVALTQQRCIQGMSRLMVSISSVEQAMIDATESGRSAKCLRLDMETVQRENERLKRQLRDKDRRMEERLQRMEDMQTKIAETLNQLLADSSRCDMICRLDTN